MHGLGRWISVSNAVSSPSPCSCKALAVKGDYRLTYTAKDAAGNQAWLRVDVTVVDPTEPAIRLDGNADMTAEAGLPFIDPFGTIADPIEGDLTADLGSNAGTAVDTSVLGVYTVTYYMTKADRQGLLAFNVTRTVRVVDRTDPVSGLCGC